MSLATLCAATLLASPLLVQEAQLLSKAADPSGPEQGVLGRSLDYTSGALLAGAPYANTGSGFATLFQLDPSGRATKVQDVSWSLGQFDDYFGWSTGISTTHAAVGAKRSAIGALLNAGRVQLYSRGTGALGQVQLSPLAVLTSAQPVQGGNFGEALDLEGSALAVGEPGGNGSSNGSGTIQIFDLSTSPVSSIAQVAPPNGSGGDEFGAHLLLRNNSLLGTAIEENAGGQPRAGAVHLFKRDSSGVWSHSVRLVSPQPETDAAFGYGLEVVGGRIYVGAPYEDGAGTDLGAVYVFERHANGYVLVQKIAPHQPNHQFLFGTSIRVEGARMFVGAPGSDASAGRGGAVQVFRDTASGWQYYDTILPPDIGVGDRFGLHTVIEAGRLVVSAKGGDEPYFNSGNAYVYATNGTAPPPMTALYRFVEAGKASTHYMLLRTGPSNAGAVYFVVGSGDATLTPSTVAGVRLPFAFDAYSQLTFVQANNGPFGATFGVLDGQGAATATIDLVGSLTSSLAGVTLYHATAVIDPTGAIPVQVVGPTPLVFVP